jgi:hypothetical protein
MSIVFLSPLAGQPPLFSSFWPPSLLWLSVRRFFLNSERPPGWTWGGVEGPGGMFLRGGVTT